MIACPVYFQHGSSERELIQKNKLSKLRCTNARKQILERNTTRVSSKHWARWFLPSWSPIPRWLFPLCLYMNVTWQTLHCTCRAVSLLQSFLNETLAEMPSVCSFDVDAHTPARLCVSLYVVMKCSGAKRPYLALRCDFRACSSGNKMLAIGGCGWTRQILWLHTLV